MAVAIPLTTTTDLYTNPGAAVFDFGGTPFQAGYFYVQNAAAYVSLRVGNSLGQSDWQTELPYSPTLIPLLAGDATPWRRTTGPDLIYGVRARSLVAGTPAVVYGGAFQPGEATSLPSNQLTGTVTPSGGITPGVSEINGITGSVSAAGGIVSGSGYTVTHIAPGQYQINFTAAFSSAPIVVATIHDEGNDYFISWLAAGPNSVQIITGLPASANMDNGFDFIAIAAQ